MTTPDITPEDTAAMRAQPGDFRAYLRAEMDRGRSRREKPRPIPQPPITGHRPGAWPTGTRSPDPPPPIPPAEVDRATAEYRHWIADGQPPGAYRCECPACQLTQGGTR